MFSIIIQSFIKILNLHRQHASTVMGFLFFLYEKKVKQAKCDAILCNANEYEHAYCMCNSFNFNSSIVIECCVYFPHWSVYIVHSYKIERKWKQANERGRASDFLKARWTQFMHDYPLNTPGKFFHISIYGNFRYNVRGGNWEREYMRAVYIVILFVRLLFLSKIKL